MKSKSGETKEKKDRVNEELAALKNQLIRALADYDNLAKRVAREREVLSKIAGLNLVQKLLPILDMLRQSQKHIMDAGLAITTKEFEDVLKSEGFEEIGVKEGDEFDPLTMEVVETVENEQKDEENRVAEVILPGWRHFEGEVIRHTKVKVKKGQNK